MLGDVVVVGVDAARDVVDRVVDAADDVVVRVVVGATVSAPGSAERMLSGEAIATPMTPSAATTMTTMAICAPEDRRGAGAWTGVGCGAGMYCGTACLGG